MSEVDWFFFGTYASEHCKESITHLEEGMSLEAFLRVHEYCKIMSDYGREEHEKARKEAESNRQR